MKAAISITILLFFPILYKMVKDWKGVKHPAPGEVGELLMVMVICSGAAELPLLDYSHAHGKHWDIILFFKYLAVSMTGFQLFFPYLFNWHWSKAHTDIFSLKQPYQFKYRLWYIFNHLSDTAIPDRWAAYRAMGWLGRLLLWSSLFGLSLWWFYR